MRTEIEKDGGFIIELVCDADKRRNNNQWSYTWAEALKPSRLGRFCLAETATSFPPQALRIIYLPKLEKE